MAPRGFLFREDLGIEGSSDRIKRLSRMMSRSDRRTPSLAHPPLPDRDWGPGFEIPLRTQPRQPHPESPGQSAASQPPARVDAAHDEQRRASVGAAWRL